MRQHIGTLCVVVWSSLVLLTIVYNMLPKPAHVQILKQAEAAARGVSK